ncbi:MAG: hypothetical protein IKA87_04570 [Lentisphaeria bacterium]|nr:hypothetical protein [Lentisphaeria bacterium]
MTFFAFILIVFSAGLHASWNLIAKRSAMTVSFYAVICMTAASMWIHTQFWTPVYVPGLPKLFFVYVICSVISDLCYCLGLVRAYRTMEMSTAYPMMRSLPLLLTAAVTSLVGWGAPLTPLALLGMAVVFVGCIIMPMKDFSSFNWRNYVDSKMFFVFLVACGTTGYTIFDSQAQSVLRGAYPELAKPIVSMTFYSTRGIFLSTLMGISVLCFPGEKKNFAAFFKERNWMPFLAGAFASLTYITVLMAMNYVTNVSYVQVFRQLGLIFGLLGGIFILKERFALPKVVGVALIITGLVITVL